LCTTQYDIWCGRWCIGSGLGCWYDICWLDDDVDRLHVKRMNYSGFSLYNYIGLPPTVQTISHSVDILISNEIKWVPWSSNTCDFNQGSTQTFITLNINNF
jgi:hypothetical protein